MLKGTLDDFTLPDIFRLMSLAKKTGKLDVTRSAGTGTVFFRDGDVYYAESSVAREPLGQKLIKAGHLTEGQLMKALDEHASSGVRVGEVLVTMAVVTEEQLQRAVQEQIEDAVFDLLRWDLGEFSWESGVIADVEVPIQVSGENLIMEASRKLDELETLLRKIPSENAVLAMSSTPPEGAVEIRFTPEEWRLLVLVDGRRSIHDIAELTGMDDLSAIRAFYGVVSAGLVEVVDPGVAEPEAVQPSVPEEIYAEPAPAPAEAPEPEVEEFEPVMEAPEPAVEAELLEAPEPAVEAELLEAPKSEPLLEAPQPIAEPEPFGAPVEETAPQDEELPEEVLAEPDAAALADVEPVGVPDLDILTEEPIAFEPPAPEPEIAGEEGAPAGEVAEEEPAAAARTTPEEAPWEAFAPETFDAPAPDEIVTETPPEDSFLSDLLQAGPAEAPAPPAPEAPTAGPPPAAPPAPLPPEEPEAPAPAEEAPEVDRAAVARELAGLFDDDIEQRSQPVRPPAARKEAPAQGEGAAEGDERKRVEDDDQVTRGLISRLIDGVKGL